MSSRRAEEPSRLGTLLLLLGCATVLAGAFGAGIVAGRYWPGLVPALGPGVAARGEAERAGPRPAEARLSDRIRPPEPPPVLTFYQELTAPLTPPAPPGTKARAESRGTGPRWEPIVTDQTRLADLGPAKSSGDGGGRRFTIQVGAFNQRAPAERLRATLVAAGHDAYLSEVEAAGIARYRVRVGAFDTRDEAREAARRLAAERKLATYVTAR